MLYSKFKATSSRKLQVINKNHNITKYYRPISSHVGKKRTRFGSKCVKKRLKNRIKSTWTTVSIILPLGLWTKQPTDWEGARGSFSFFCVFLGPGRHTWSPYSDYLCRPTYALHGSRGVLVLILKLGGGLNSYCYLRADESCSRLYI